MSRSRLLNILMLRNMSRTLKKLVIITKVLLHVRINVMGLIYHKRILE